MFYDTATLSSYYEGISSLLLTASTASCFSCSVVRSVTISNGLLIPSINAQSIS